MKAAALILKLEDGTMHAVANASAVPLQNLAKEIRASGAYTVGKKPAKVTEVIGLTFNGGVGVPWAAFRPRVMA